MNRAIALLEESLQILRNSALAILIPHWTGAIPFAIALLLLINDMRLTWGAPFLLRDSLLCAIAFWWLCYWKSQSARATYSLLTSDRLMGRTVWLQSFFQTPKLFILPFAAISLVLWPAASAFFRTLALEPRGAHRPLRSGLQRAFAAATTRYTENALAFVILAVLAVIAFINIFSLLAALPFVWKTVTGYETDWSRIGSAGLQMAFTAAIATWLLLDPWFQTCCILRLFYQDARSDGRDLLRDIARLSAIVLLCIAAVPAQGAAEKPALTNLDQGIQQASQSRDYAWLRRPKATPADGFTADLARKIEDAYHQVTTAFRNAWRKLFPNQTLPHDDARRPPPQSTNVRWVFALIALLLCACILAAFIHRSNTRKAPLAPPAENAARADILDATLLPSDVNQEEWLRLAAEYLANNQTRLAARAFYLANLSYLGSHSLLSLSLTKSNKLYERELARNPKSNQLSSPFNLCNRLYERAWFGMRELGSEQVGLLKGAAEQLRQHV